MDKFANLNDYLEQLKKRKKQSKIYQKYQLTGLILADLLKDKKHKTLYIKLAKQINNDKLIEIAKLIKENEKIKNPGAYFMWKLKNEGLLKNIEKNTKNIQNKKIKILRLFKFNKKKVKNE
ncbi:MAG: hypothetical protein N2Z85_00180 [Patescibacteria group bacterium]|nr:hypothetical protein [Patescibacteria group bacterium]